MLDPLAKKRIYRACRAATGLNKRQWGRIFALGNLKNTDQVVGHKENPELPGPGSTSKGVNMSEALASQLLFFLSEEGYDVGSIEFDEGGLMKPLKKDR